MSDVTVRAFNESDIPELLELMQGLARFEGYIDDFRVTHEDLLAHGLGPSPRFEAFVAETNDIVGLVGMAVVYHIPWTYDLRPTLIMKELFVRDEGRGRGVGRALLRSVAGRALELDCPRLQWTVLDTNDPAKRFYATAGATKDEVWEPWSLNEDGLRALVEEG
jgi:GNAT superfamily N-acetyltransferase